MKRKIPVSIISTACAAVLLLGGWSVYAAASPAPATTGTLTGTLTAVNAAEGELTLTTESGTETIELAQSVWVYRDGHKALLSDLKPGDRIEAIENTKDQAAYVKAVSAEAAGETGASVEASATPASPTPSATPSATPSVSPSVSPEVTATPAPTEGEKPHAAPGLSEFLLKIEGKHFKLHIQQHPVSGGQMSYELTLKAEGSPAVHLKSEAAAAWIQAVVGTVDLKAADAQQQLLQQVAAQYNIDPAHLQVKMNAKFDKASEESDEQEEKAEVSTETAAPTAAPTEAAQIQVQGKLQVQSPVSGRTEDKDLTQGRVEDHGKNQAQSSHPDKPGKGESKGNHGSNNANGSNGKKNKDD